MLRTFVKSVKTAQILPANGVELHVSSGAGVEAAPIVQQMRSEMRVQYIGAR
jgi:hypothetical protein